MRVFRPTRKDKAGKAVAYRRWYVEFRDHLETTRRLPGFTDKRQTEELSRHVEKLVACRANGYEPDTRIAKWLGSMPRKTLATLAQWGLLERQNVAAGEPLAEHLRDFEAALTAKGTTSKQARLVVVRARRVFEHCRFVQWSDLSPSKVQACLAELRDGESGISLQTSNFYLQAVKQFCKWMVRDGRASQSPLVHLQALNVSTDRRHDRRALSVDELRWLLDTTATAPDRRGVSGYERYLVYRLAVESGLRAGEVRSLRRASFDFDAKPATVRVEAAYSKRRRRDVLPMRAETAALLRDHLANKLPDAPAFQMPKKDRVAHVLRADLADARARWLITAGPEMESSDFLAYRNHAGLVVDFHALRHTFITNLANSGVHPKVAQQLARHSTITLTMDRYTHTVWEELGEALAGLPSLSGPPRDTMRATGTDGRPESPSLSVAFCVARNDAAEDNSVQSDAVSGAPDDGPRASRKPSNSSDYGEKSQENESGSAWESNPPAVRFTHGTTVLKTAATTRCAGTSGRYGAVGCVAEFAQRASRSRAMRRG